ncbi:MAG: beta-glucuronidase [Methylococcaceae bacterium]|nr:beta-glucuronidase [Methylococcaceae bacterium]
MLYPQQNISRNKFDLSGIWDFKIDPDRMGERNGWHTGLDGARPIAVPGSWNEQYEDIYNYLGLAWYVKSTYVPQYWQGQRVFLRVGSACYFSTIYVNGIKMGSHEGGHLPFVFEVTDHLCWKTENTIAISVENDLMPTRVPSGNMSSPLMPQSCFPRTTYDFFPFAGIHRPVVLYSVPPVYIEDITVITGINGLDGTVKVRVQLNSADTIQGSVHIKGDEVTFTAKLMFKDGLAEAHLIVHNANFWSDKTPYLYDLTVQTEQDQYTLKVGVRTVKVQGGQIFLNDKPIHLNGYGRHEDFYASGKGLNQPLMVKDYQLMRWTGANSYRTSHYPYSEEEMQLADREGFLIINEIPAVSLQFDNDENIAIRLRTCLQQVDELITRDKNHASVVMWCIANEPLIAQPGLGVSVSSNVFSVAKGKEFLGTLMQRVRTLDPTRLVTFVALMGSPSSWVEQCDVICMNRYWGWYILGGELNKALISLEQELDSAWETWHKPIMITEFGADTMAGMHGHPNAMWTEEYQAEFVRGYLTVAARKDFIAGMQVWNFADFASIQSIMRVGGMNMKGIFTRGRTPKMAAHVLREFWIK